MKTTAKRTLFFLIILTLLLECPGPFACFAQAETPAAAIENVRVQLIDNGCVAVWYDLIGDPEMEHEVTMGITITNRQNRPEMLTGDVGKGVAPGKDRRILWEAEKEMGGPVQDVDVDLFVVSTLPLPPTPPISKKERLMASSKSYFKLARIGLGGGGAILVGGAVITAMGADSSSASPEEANQNMQFIELGVGTMAVGALFVGFGFYSLIQGARDRSKANKLPDLKDEVWLNRLRLGMATDGNEHSLVLGYQF